MSRILKVFMITIFACLMSFQAFASESLVSRIIGGTTASNGEFPFQAGLVIDQGGGSYSFFCGGTIISSKWILTAAHCFDDYDATHVITGTNLTSPIDGSKLTAVSRIIKHSGYDQNSDSYNNDIALIELVEPVSSAPIDSASKIGVLGYAVGTLATVTGWGEYIAYKNNTYSDALRKVNVPVVSSAECISSYDSIRVTDNMICAGYSSGGYDSCQGDSGGPLFVQNSNGTETLIGVVSWGTGCAQPDYYGVYTKVANYTSWIETNTGLKLATHTIAAETFTNSSDAVTAINANPTYDINTSAFSSFKGSFRDSSTVEFNGYVYGGNLTNFSVSDSSASLELLYTTKAKIEVDIDTDGDVDAALIIQYPDGDSDDYYLIKCLGNVSSLVTCKKIDEVTYNSAGKWAMIYLNNNDVYDANQYGVTSDANGESRAIGDDTIETTIYLARDYQVSDIIGGGGGGGGCSAGNGAAYGLTVLIFFCVVYLMRRKMMSNIKENQDK